MPLPTKQWLFGLAHLAFFLLLCLTYLLGPIKEPDFFWHLKTGEWIWQNGMLPATDPFSFTSPTELSTRQVTILQGYWLAQLLIHAIVSAFGDWGVFLLRLTMLALFYGMFLVAFESGRVSRWLSFPLIALVLVFYLDNYALERPQVFSFIGLGLLLFLYHGQRKALTAGNSHPWHIAACFVLMTAWSNLHPGFVLGQMVLATIVFAEGIIFLQSRQGKGKRLRTFILLAAAGILGTQLTPVRLGVNEYLSLVGLREKSSGAVYSLHNYEYYSVFKWLFEHQQYVMLIPVAISLLSLLPLRNALARRHYAELILLVVFWTFAYRHIRYLPVAMTFSLLFIAWNLGQAAWSRLLAVPLLVVLCGTLWLRTADEFIYLQIGRTVRLDESFAYPTQAVEFLEQRNYRGRLFNTYNWGSYLLWRLGPEVQVATDSRVINEESYLEMKEAGTLQPGPSGRPLWKDVMDKYRINAALIPVMNGPRPSQLAGFFAADRDWVMVHRDRLAVVFFRKQKMR